MKRGEDTKRESGTLIGQYPCQDCGSQDNLSVYQHDGGGHTGYCWGRCAAKSKGYKSNNTLAEWGVDGVKSIKKRSGSSVIKETREGRRMARNRTKKTGEVISSEQKKRIKDTTQISANGYRGIKDKYLKRNSVRTSIDEETGEVTDRYYPITLGKTEEGKPMLVGYHRRICSPKDFRAIGLNSTKCELFGQWRCKGKGKLVITAGQEDKLAAEQMFDGYRNSRGKDAIKDIDFVSGTVGETSLFQQLKHNFDFINQYDLIILDMDDDEAGHNALQACLEVIPAGKARVMQYSVKDANEALEEGLEREYISAIYDAKKPKIAGVVAGEHMWSAMMDNIDMDLIPLPPMLKPLEDMLFGGLPRGEIVNILAASGIGKTSITNNLTLYWLFNSPCKIGVLSMEAGAGKYLLRLVSGYLGKNIPRLRSKEEKIAYLEENREKCEELFFDENGEERFSLVDDSGGIETLEDVKQVMERMIIYGSCDVIIVDPVTDLLDSLSIEDQAAFVGWQKKIKGRYKVTFINVNHTRKSGGGSKAGSQGGQLTEEDMQGTSALYKSGAVNIILTRDKTNEDPEVRNTTKVTLFKARDTGETGVAGEIYYEGSTATLYNKADWLKRGGLEEDDTKSTEGDEVSF